MKNPLLERPWILIVVALGLFVLAWTIFLVVAERHKPASVPIIVSPPHEPR